MISTSGVGLADVEAARTLLTDVARVTPLEASAHSATGWEARCG